jgi:hypothetical protein
MEKKKIVTKHERNGVYAYFADNPEKWGWGINEVSAIGELVLTTAKQLNIELEQSATEYSRSLEHYPICPRCGSPKLAHYKQQSDNTNR